MMPRVGAGEGGRRCLPLTVWPAGDSTSWAAATCPGDLLLDGGPAAQLRPGSLRKRAAAYGRWLGWLADTDRLDPDAAPAARVTRAAVAAYVADLRRVNAPLTVLGRIADLAAVLRWFAPELDWSWLRAIVARLRGRVGTAPQDRKRARLRSGQELLALGRRLMATAVTATGLSQRRRARRYRDGLMIALLAARPLRLANLVQLMLGRELVRRGEGWWLEIPGADTKTGAPLELPFPDELVPALEAYLSTWRPQLARPGRSTGCSALWLSNRGRGLSDQQAYSQIVAHTRAAFGQPVNPHLFRDTAATTLARDRPAQVRLAAPLLGHRSYATTERYYNLARDHQAATAWHDVLEKIAEEG
jgi:integrase/recombinase XerD